MQLSLYTLAQRFVGIREVPGDQSNPFIQWCLEACDGFGGETPDEIPWCSAFVNRMAWILRLPRSKRANARSWLTVGLPVALEDAQVGDIVIFWRGSLEAATGHVGIYGGVEGDQILVLGGNQGDQVCLAKYPKARLLGVRRIEGDTRGDW